MSVRACWLTLTCLLLIARASESRSQPLGANPSAAPSEVGNPSSMNPAARPSDIRNPAAINPSAAATQPLPSITPGRSPALTRAPRVRATPIEEEAERRDERKRRPAKAPAAEDAPSCKAGNPRVGNWQALRERLASCWTVPVGTEGSSVTLRFGISSAGALRGPPLVTATNVKPKDLAVPYRNAATAVLEQCLPVCPTDDFGAMLHETTLHLRLVNDAPFPSRNLGPWMTIFARSRDPR